MNGIKYSINGIIYSINVVLLDLIPGKGPKRYSIHEMKLNQHKVWGPPHRSCKLGWSSQWR